jgi:hypothetical protein
MADYYGYAASLRERGPVDIDALVAGTLPDGMPGIGPVINVTEDWVRYNNEKYDPDNRVLNDSDYARTLGYENIIAFPSIAAHDDSILIAQTPGSRDRHLTTDLNHEINNYQPIYPGDTLYLVIDGVDIYDLTPTAGSTYRFVAVECRGSVYNQDKVRVQDLVFRTTRGLRLYADPSRVVENATFADLWDAPNWRARPTHYYTDDDWAMIRNIWQNEKHQGAEPLYWEDVAIGDRPTWTADGPVEASPAPIAPWGTGAGGSRSIRHEIMDPEIFPTLVRSESDGIYRLPARADQLPAVPDGTDPRGMFALTALPDEEEEQEEVERDIDSAEIHTEVEGRSILLNYVGREYAIRHINNWMGDAGWVENLRWSIMDPRAFPPHGYSEIPQFQLANRFLRHVPDMANRYVNIHGLTKDLGIVKSYVYDKYVRNDEDYIVELVWWVENIEGDIWQEGGATVRLPSRRRAEEQ